MIFEAGFLNGFGFLDKAMGLQLCKIGLYIYLENMEKF